MIILGVASSGGLLSKGSNRDEARYMRRDRPIRGCKEQRIERGGEERAMAVPEGKSNGSENHHLRDGVGKSNGGEGVGKNLVVEDQQ